MKDTEFVAWYLDELLHGNGSILTTDNSLRLNNIAQQIYAKRSEKLSTENVQMLKQLLMICNIVYNRTSLEMMIIEDGFYDILLEIYKEYDKNFQVGSAVVQVRNLVESGFGGRPVATPPIYFFPDHERDEVHQQVYEAINRLTFKKVDHNKCPIVLLDNSEQISKRTHNTRHNHPDLVGTLDKVKFVFNQDAIDAGVFNDPNVKVFERDFIQDHVKKGIIHPNQKITIVCELKYDGISVEADCGLEVISARTRGDTGIGEAADITPILRGYQFHRASCMIGEQPLGVKFEAIMTKHNLVRFNEMRGKSYANCRSAIVGLFGASDAYMYRDLITLIPLAIDREQMPQISNRLEEIRFLNEVFQTDHQPLRHYVFTGTIPEIMYFVKAFYDEAVLARDYLDFMFDGIVVSYVDEDIRRKLGRSNFINKYSIAIKFNPIEKQTVFRGYTYEVGKNGVITPMIHYDPVEFLGTIHTKSTGSSLARFKSLALKEGDYISVKYVNDVMPYVSKMECKHNLENHSPVVKIIDVCPLCGTKLVESDSGKTLMCPNISCKGRSLSRMTAMFQALNIKGFAEANLAALEGFDHLYKIEKLADFEYLKSRLGEVNAMNFLQVRESILCDTWWDYIVVGSLGFSGLASKNWKNILQKVHLKDILTSTNVHQLLVQKVPNIGPKRIQTIIEELPFFKEDLEFILNKMNLRESYCENPENTMQIRMTGFRNQQLTEQLSTVGIDADDSSVTKNTTILLVPYIGFESGKVKKAQQYGVKIVSIMDFMKNPEEYIGIPLPEAKP